MTGLDFHALFVQLVLPLSMVLWLLLSPAKSTSGFFCQFVATLLALVALMLSSVWLAVPWWTPLVYAFIGMIALSRNLSRRRKTARALLPKRRHEWISATGFLILGGWCLLLIADAVAGRFVPQADAVALEFPLGEGTFLVANGGSTASVNGHFLTLEPKTDRQRKYRGQSYGVDLIKLGNLGLRARGWRPRDPAAYVIFGSPVYAPCAGTVLFAIDELADMPVPETDTRQLEGNHVFLQCGDHGVLLAHLRRDSVTVSKGDRVVSGQQLAEVGNSGQSYEPHLHIHAQRLAGSLQRFSGEPLFITFDGAFPVRNQRIVIAAP